MAKIISIEEFLKDTLEVKAERIYSVLQEIDDYNEWAVWDKVEVEEYAKRYREKYNVEHWPCCPLCDDEFENDEKIYTEYINNQLKSLR